MSFWIDAKHSELTDTLSIDESVVCPSVMLTTTARPTLSSVNDQLGRLPLGNMVHRVPPDVRMDYGALPQSLTSQTSREFASDRPRIP